MFLARCPEKLDVCEERSIECRGEREKNTHLSPRRSMTYALTPPGILTSTQTSTRENALKQLHRGINGCTEPIRAGADGKE